MFLLALLGACTPKTTDDTATEQVDTSPATTDTSSEEPCTAPYITVEGSDPPVVGDEWDVYLWCDGTLLLGSTVLRFDPSELARIEANHATFVDSGAGSLVMQVGRYSATRDVKVAAAP